jgi:hypothetical protein
MNTERYPLAKYRNPSPDPDENIPPPDVDLPGTDLTHYPWSCKSPRESGYYFFTTGQKNGCGKYDIILLFILVDFGNITAYRCGQDKLYDVYDFFGWFLGPVNIPEFKP